MMGSKIQTDKIPESDSNVLVRSLLGIISDYYADPDNQKDFEEWLKANGGTVNGWMEEKSIYYKKGWKYWIVYRWIMDQFYLKEKSTNLLGS